VPPQPALEVLQVEVDLALLVLVFDVVKGPLTEVYLGLVDGKLLTFEEPPHVAGLTPRALRESVGN
jgi:hypothetical protein